MSLNKAGRSKTVAIRIPRGLYDVLVDLANEEQTSPSTMAGQFVANQIRAYASMHANTKAANLMDWMMDKFAHDFEGAPVPTPPRGAAVKDGPASGGAAVVGVSVAPPQEAKNGRERKARRSEVRT